MAYRFRSSLRFDRTSVSVFFLRAPALRGKLRACPAKRFGEAWVSVVNFYLANGPKYVGKKSLEVRNGSRASALGRNGR